MFQNFSRFSLPSFKSFQKISSFLNPGFPSHFVWPPVQWLLLCLLLWCCFWRSALPKWSIYHLNLPNLRVWRWNYAITRYMDFMIRRNDWQSAKQNVQCLNWKGYHLHWYVVKQTSAREAETVLRIFWKQRHHTSVTLQRKATKFLQKLILLMKFSKLIWVSQTLWTSHW